MAGELMFMRGIRDMILGRNGGYFVEHLPNGRLKFHKNTVTELGATDILKQYFRGEDVAPATFYLGLTNAGYTFSGTTLAGLAAGEPVGNGYARQAIAQDTDDWTVQTVNGSVQLLSKICQFTASGNWTQNWIRGFICTAEDGTDGDVLAVSGPAPAPRTVLEGAGPTIQYTFYFRG